MFKSAEKRTCLGNCSWNDKSLRFCKREFRPWVRKAQLCDSCKECQYGDDLIEVAKRHDRSLCGIQCHAGTVAIYWNNWNNAIRCRRNGW